MNKILVIDDSDLVSGLLKEHLSQEGFEVALAMDANQGYTKALEFDPDLILLDIQLPDVTGLDMIRVIKNREQLRHIPIIMITGTHHKTENKVQALKAGADDYVLKPFEMPELVERIRAVLRRSEASEKKMPSVPVVKAPPPAAVPQGAAAAPAALSWAQLMEKTLFDPRSAAKELPFARLALTYLLVALGLVLLGVYMTAGSHIKPVIAGLWVTSAWGAAVATLVMSCSIMGLHLSWKEGSYLISLSGIPVLMKIAGGTALSLLVGLSPFYFAAGPALFWNGVPWAAGRLDLFEIWSTVLLWILMRQRSGGGRRMGAIATALVWLVSAAWAAVLLKLISTGPQ